MQSTLPALSSPGEQGLGDHGQTRGLEKSSKIRSKFVCECKDSQRQQGRQAQFSINLQSHMELKFQWAALNFYCWPCLLSLLILSVTAFVAHVTGAAGV